jgi:peroxiredoxin Q/BCP
MQTKGNKMLIVGQTAPNFSLLDSTNATVNLADFKGKQNVVLYFYPKDDTEGCTIEAQGFSQSKSDYDKLETVVLGVSKDTTKSHAKFCNRYGLIITLLSDPEQKAIDAYDVWQEKSMFGKKYMGIVRTTFLIDKEGIIRHIWPKVSPKGHESEVLREVALIT